MTVEHVDVLVEEASMEAALQVVLPKILGATAFSVHPHQGKAELLQRLPDRLRGYAAWMPANYRVLVVVDRDDEDCKRLKKRMEQMARDAGLRTRTTARALSIQVINRIAVEELEAWFFGDWEAVRAAYPRADRNVPQKSKFRNPDAIHGGTWEALERVLQDAGYFDGGLRKIEAARVIAGHMVPARNTSRSFKVFYEALSGLAISTGGVP